MGLYHDTEHDEPVVVTTSQDEELDAEQFFSDKIAREIARRFPTHDMARLVEGILEAKGYATYFSPPGPDGGVDILASKGDLGFESPKICVQVKSGTTPTDRPTLDQLVGTMQNFNAEQGLLVSWGGFRTSVQREESKHFFSVRLWDSQDLVNELKIKGFESCAITDHSNMFGAVEFYHAMKGADLKPIIGLGASVAKENVNFSVNKFDRRGQMQFLCQNKLFLNHN